MSAGVGRRITNRTDPVTSRTVVEVRKRELITWACAGLTSPVGCARHPRWTRACARPGWGCGLAGSSPLSDPLVAGGHTWPTPQPIPAGTSADRHSGTVMPRDPGLGLLLKWTLPVLGTPAAGVGGVDRHHDQPGVVGHAAQAFPEPCGGDTVHGAAEGFATLATAHRFPPRPTSVGEPEVLDRNPRAVVLFRRLDEVRDRRAQPAVALRGRAGQVERDGVRIAHGVAVDVYDACGEVIGVEIHRQQPCTGFRQLVWRGRGDHLGRPRGVQIPTATVGVVHDVVPDGSVRGGSVEPLAAAMMERNPTVQPVPAPRAVGQMPQRFGQHQGHTAIARIDSDRIVSPRRTGLAVGGQEQSSRVPACPPLPLGQPGVLQMMPCRHQTPASHGDGGVALLDLAFHRGEPSLQRDEPLLFLPPLGLVGIATCPALTLSTRDTQPATDSPDRAPQTHTVLSPASDRELVLVLRGAGDRAGPPRR